MKKPKKLRVGDVFISDLGSMRIIKGFGGYLLWVDYVEVSGEINNNTYMVCSEEQFLKSTLSKFYLGNLNE